MFDLFHSRPQRSGFPSRLRPDRKPLLENLEDRLAPAIIGGTVYADLNGNGLFNPGEAGLANSTLQLQDTAGNVLATTTSNQNGQYEFTQRTVGTTASAVQAVDAVFSPTPTNSSNTVSVSQFNPALGTLNAVDFIATGSLSSNVQLENLGPGSSPFQVNLGGSLSFSAPGLGSAFSSTTGSSCATGGTGAATTGTATSESSWMTGGTGAATTGTATSGSSWMTGGTGAATTGTATSGSSCATGGTGAATTGTATSGSSWMTGGTGAATTGTATSGSSCATGGTGAATTGTATSESSWMTGGPYISTTGTATSASDCTMNGTSPSPNGPTGPTDVMYTATPGSDCSTNETSTATSGSGCATNSLTSVSPGTAISNPLSSMSCGAGWMSGGASTTTSSSGSWTTGSSATVTGTTTSSSSGIGCTTTGTTTSSALSSGQLGTQLTGALAGFPSEGQVNLSGPSSANLGTTTLNGTFNQVSLTSPQALAAYTGTGTVNVTETGSAGSCVCGPGNLLSLINTVAQGDLKVVYQYTPSNALAPGQYNIVQTTQPPGYTAGLATSDNITPIAGSNLTHTIPVTVNTTCDVLTNNNFGELPPPPSTPTPPSVVPTPPVPTPPSGGGGGSTTPSISPYIGKYFLFSSNLASLGW